MNQFTGARSTPGKRGTAGTDDRELFAAEVADMLLEAWEESNDFEGWSYERTIVHGKSDDFPVIGRKRDAFEHDPGDQVLGGNVESNAVTITVDKMLVDAVFIAEIDELLASYSLAAPYARQLGQSLATTYDRRLATLIVKAARVVTPAYTNGPVGGSITDAAMKTDPSKLEAAAFTAVEQINSNDIGGGETKFFMPWQQYLLLSKWSGIDATITSGEGNRSLGSVGKIAGIRLRPCNHIPKTVISTGNSKFQGDFSKTVGFIANPMAVGILNVRGLKLTVGQKDDRLGTLMIASKLNGMGILRPETSREVALP